MNAFHGASVLLATVCLYGFLAALPQAPTFQRAKSVLTDHDEIHVELRIVPHPDIRAVTLEAWTSAADDFSCTRDPLAFVRGSSEPVNELNRSQRTFPFRWRQSFPDGCYVFIGKIALPTGLTKERRHALRVGFPPELAGSDERMFP